MTLEAIDTLAELNSDHSPVSLKLVTSFMQPHRSEYVKIIPNWPFFSDYLKLLEFPSEPLTSTNEVDTAISAITTTIRSAYLSCSTRVRPLPTELLPNIRPLIQEKRALRRRWQRLRNPNDKRRLNLISNQIHSIIKSYKFDSFHDTVADAQTSNTIWKFLAKIRGRSTPSSSPLHGPTGVLF